jgi:3-hydroxyisobutyrate dehydrogenase-like beta-hydroxyacid dehydrogenase
MSTICPIETIEISKFLKKYDISLVDAPVSGGEIGAIKRKFINNAGWG